MGRVKTSGVSDNRVSGGSNGPRRLMGTPNRGDRRRMGRLCYRGQFFALGAHVVGLIIVSAGGWIVLVA